MNSTTRFLFVAALACAAVCVISGTLQSSTIATVETQASGSSATIGDDGNNPVITSMMKAPGSGDGYTYTGYAFLANDGTGSLDVFSNLPSGSTYVPTVGDAISATGTYSPFNHIPELASLTSITQKSTGNSVPGPTVVTVPDMLALSSSNNFAIQEYLVEIDNVTFTSGPAFFPFHANQAFTVTDGSNTLTVFFNPSTYSISDPLASTAVPAGLCNITGIAQVFGAGNTVEIAPFTVTPVPEPTTLTLGLLAVGGSGIPLLIRRLRRRGV